MTDTREWCETALAAVSSLWNAREHHAWRTSKSVPKNERGHNRSKSSAYAAYYPTATFHAIAAFGTCGAWDSGSEYEPSSQTLRTPYMEVRNVAYFSEYEDVLGTLVGRSQSWKSGQWVKIRVEASSHRKARENNRTRSSKSVANPRQAFVIGRLFQALQILVASAIQDREELTARIDEIRKRGGGVREIQKAQRKIRELEQLLRKVEEGMPNASEYLLYTIEREDVKDEISLADLSASPSMSPYLLLQVALGIVEYEAILKRLKINSRQEQHTSEPKEPIGKLKEVLERYFVREVDRLMSRRQVPSDPHYDAASLAFAIHGLTLVNESIREKPLFRACVEAIVAGQNSDGCWSDSRSATFDDTGTTIQQPSVAVALSLAECIFSPKLLLENDPWGIELLNIGLGALKKTARYLTQSMATQIKTESGRVCSGWVSDRVRWPQVSETWITAMAARLFYYLWLAERACSRTEILSLQGVRWPQVKSSSAPLALKAATAEPLFDPDAWIKGVLAKNSSIHKWIQEPPEGNTDVEKWYQKIIDPDSDALPIGTLVDKVLNKIEKQRKQQRYFRNPDKNGVSFIIYGPPGSGKTFFISKIAGFLGWPLLTLNPGHFIKGGLESIEATSAEIFSALMRLDHTVVFFDECDELFLERSERKGATGGRNILSFATACMLPKLQELHDAGRIIFFLGTNYVSRVDTAIRRPGRFDDLLLFDRPDENARKLHINREWKKEWNEKWKDNLRGKGGAEPAPALQREMASEADKELTKIFPVLVEAPQKTAGWMIKDIHRYASTLASGEDFTDKISIDDYVAWCAVEGEQELRATRLPEETILSILRRWYNVDKGLYEEKYEEAYPDKFNEHLAKLKGGNKAATKGRR